MTRPLGRREFLKVSAAVSAAVVAGPAALADDAKPKLKKAVKYGMVGIKGTHREKLELVKKCGFLGVEIDSPGTAKLDELVEASKATGIAVHGVIDSVHWSDTLSHPDEKVRAKGLAALEGALKDAKTVGADTVLQQIIRLVHDVAAVVNNDRRVGDRLKVAFIPNYGVSVAEVIMPGADLSEQISTAGTEASGTGNMKLALNGALTIGTLDGANIEIGQAVGDDNIFIFGLRTPEVEAQRRAGYQPMRIYEQHPRLKSVLDMIASGAFSPDEPHRYRGVVDALLWGGDHYFLLADYDSYIATQRQVDQRFRDRDAWARSAIANVAGMGPFSADRTIGQYAEQIWRVQPRR